MKVDGIYAGKIQVFGESGQPSAIQKDKISSAVVNETGIVTDEQADLRYHGGVEKALHQFSQRSYDIITAEFPELIGKAVSGSIGENLTSLLMDETNVHIGDIYAIGDVRLQVSEPRVPCWKIDERFKVTGVSKFIADNGLNGWYFRVLTPGEFNINDRITLEKRLNDTFSLADFFKVTVKRNPSRDELLLLSGLDGLSEQWKARIGTRLKSLSE